MPALTPEQRQALLGPSGHCHRCRATKIRHYCRTCDQFYFTCLCQPKRDPGCWTEHDDHRVYVWTPTGVLAIPDFDALLER